MTKKQLKEKLIEIRNGAFITPILEEIWEEMEQRKIEKAVDLTMKHYGETIRRLGKE